MVLLVFPTPKNVEEGEIFSGIVEYFQESLESDLSDIYIDKGSANLCEVSTPEFLEPYLEVVLFGAEVFDLYKTMCSDFLSQVGESNFKSCLHQSYLGPFREVFVTYNPCFQFSAGKDLTWVWLALKIRLNSNTFPYRHHQMVENLYVTGLDLGPVDDQVNRTVDWLRGLKVPEDWQGQKTVALDVETNIWDKGVQTAFHPGHVVLSIQFSTFDLNKQNYSTFVAYTRCWSPHHHRKVFDVFKELNYVPVTVNGMFDFTAVAVACQIFPTRERQKLQKIGHDITTPFRDIVNLFESYFGDFQDTHYFIKCLDQGSNESSGLKGTSQRFLGAPDWSKSFWDPIYYLRGKLPYANIPKKLKNSEFSLLDIGSNRKILPGLTYPLPNKNDLVIYGAYDAYWTIRLWREVCPQLKNEFPWVTDPYDGMKDMIGTLCTMSFFGFPFNQSKVKDVRDWIDSEKEESQAELDDYIFTLIRQYGGLEDVSKNGSFNTKSTPHKQNLIKWLGLDSKVTEKTDKGGISTSAEVMERLAGDEDWGYIFKAIERVNYSRDLERTLNEYEEFLLFDRIHPTYHPTKRDDREAGEKMAKGGTKSVRLAMSNPSLHSFPHRKKPIADATYLEGFTHIIMDAKTVEPVILASISRCEKWLDLFEFGKANPGDPNGDLYRVEWAQIASLLWESRSPAEITKKERNKSKVVILAFTYDRSVYSLAVSLDCSMEQAKQIYQHFYDTAPELVEFGHNNRLRTIAGDSPRTVLNNYQSFWLDIPPQDLPLPPMTLGDLVDTLQHSANYRMSKEDQHKLRSMGNNQIQSVASRVLYYMLVYLARNLPPEMQIIKTVHDSVLFLHRGEPKEENLAWLDRVGKTPSLWLPEKAMQALHWDEYDVYQCELSWGPTRYAEDHQKWGE